MTSQTQIDQANALAVELAKISGVVSVHVDDWNDWGAFNIFMNLETNSERATPRFRFVKSLRGVINRARNMVKQAGGIWEWHEPPRPHYTVMDHKAYYEGHDRDNYKISVRFPEPLPPKPPDPQLTFGHYLHGQEHQGDTGVTSSGNE